MKERTDAELVRRTRAGDRDAFGELAERYGTMARRVAWTMVGHEEVARELAQEALLQAYLCLDTLREEARFACWLYGIVLNVCRGYRRSQRAVFTSLEALEGGRAVGPPPSLDPQQLVEAQELQRLVLAAIHALSPANRAATLLYYFEQLSLREVAAALGISEGAVKGRLHKARQQLRAQLHALDEPVSSNERRSAMVRVTVVDVVQQERGEGLSTNIVVLLDEAGQRALPIWVGPFEATAIALSLGEPVAPRPLTYQFTANLLAAAGVTLEEVRVQTLQNETFYAVAKIRQGDTVREVDARPSDAIALALVTGSPLYVAEEILAAQALAVPQAGGTASPQGRGIEEIRRKVAEEMRAFQSRAPWSEAQREQSHQAIMERVFGRQG